MGINQPLKMLFVTNHNPFLIFNLFMYRFLCNIMQGGALAIKFLLLNVHLYLFEFKTNYVSKACK